MKRLLAVVVGVSFLVFAGMAGAALVTSLPGGTVIPMPNVNSGGSVPNTFDGVTWTSTHTSSLFGWTHGYGFGENGIWDGTLGPMAGLNGPYNSNVSASMTFTFATPVSGVGGFINYAPSDQWNSYGTPEIGVYDSSNSLIESYTLNFVTGYAAVNSGFFYGFSESSANIKYFKLTDAYISITNLTTYTSTSAPVPEPGTMMLLGSGLVGLVGYGRRRFKK